MSAGIRRGRLLRASSLSTPPRPLDLATTAPLPRGRRIPRAVVDAEARAKALVATAEARAKTLLEAAARAAGDVRLRAEAEGRADGVAQVAAQAVRLSALEAQAEERGLDRAVELARLLAERLLGEALAIAPERVVALARQALKEARGARSARIVAHPEDQAVLEGSRDALGLPEGAVAIVADPARARGELRIETEIGVLDAALAPQLERLAKKLRESIRR